MAAIKTEHLTFAYPGGEPALRDVSLSVEQGEFVVLCGPSGCGKTTLLRLLKPSLAPHGTLSGRVSTAGLDRRADAARLGFVQQDPDSQIVTDKVWHELAFGLESLGLPRDAIRRRVAEMAAFFGIEGWFERPVSTLSGGQKQILNLASVLAPSPEVLLLDEPTSMLDPVAAREFLSLLARIRRELGVTVILSEHRLEEALPLCDRALVLDGGRLLCAAPPQALADALDGHPMAQALPAPARIFHAVCGPGDTPVTVGQGRLWLDGFAAAHGLSEPPPRPVFDRTGVAPAAELKQVWFRYEKKAGAVLRGLSLTVCPGELVALLGGNGAGKSTALSVLAGLERPERGKVTCGRAALLPQDPKLLFVKATVREDLTELLDGSGLTRQQRAERAEAAARRCGLTHLLDRHPYDLSGGEQQRAALAKLLLLEPEVLLLDEPTKGLDAGFKEELAAILRDLLARGTAIVMVSHDTAFCAQYADRCLLLFRGEAVAEDSPAAFFAGNDFYTTGANRMARHRLPEAVTAGDVIRACGGSPPEPPDGGKDPDAPAGPDAFPPPAAPKEPPSPPPRKRKLSRSGWTALGMLVLAVPLTIWLCTALLGPRRYYVMSALILAETLLPFFVLFERRKPQARELVLLAVLCAIAVAGRSAFYMAQQIKPMVALVIVAGAALGAESGFLIGAMTVFVSNFFFGQGPWTPWQMLAVGAIGLLAGLIFSREKPRLWALCVFGGVTTVAVYGGVMNPASVLMYQSDPTWEMFAAAYAVGLPFDLLHAVSTVVFLAILARPMLRKLTRVRVKYNILPSAG